MMYMKRYYLIFAGFIMISGCAAANLKPELDSEYPAARYLKAAGTGQSEGEARSRALAEMSRIFESNIYSDTYDRVKSVIDTSGKDTYTQSIESNIRVISGVKLKGVQIAKSWFDNGINQHIALAVLDRNQARSNWLAEIRDLDNTIEGKFRVLDSMKSKFLRLQSLKKILDIWIEREVIISRLRVLGFDEGGSVNYNIKSVFHKIPEIKANMLIFIDIDGEYAKKIKDSIAELLNRAGFILSDTKDGTDVLISGTAAAEPVKLDNPGWKFARASVILTIIDSDTGSTMGEVSENRRAGHLSYDEAVHKALEKIAPDISDKMMKFF